MVGIKKMLKKIPNRKEDGFVLLSQGFKAQYWIEDNLFVARLKLKNGQTITLSNILTGVQYQDGVCTDPGIIEMILSSFLREYAIH